MKKKFEKVIAVIFSSMAVVLSNIMCIAVTSTYCDMMCARRHSGFSGTEDIAFFFAIPYVICIIACVIIAVIFYRKSKSVHHL